MKGISPSISLEASGDVKEVAANDNRLTNAPQSETSNALGFTVSELSTDASLPAMDLFKVQQWEEAEGDTEKQDSSSVQGEKRMIVSHDGKILFSHSYIKGTRNETSSL